MSWVAHGSAKLLSHCVSSRSTPFRCASCNNLGSFELLRGLPRSLKTIVGRQSRPLPESQSCTVLESASERANFDQEICLVAQV